MTTDINDRPKYACAVCGNDEVRGDMDTCPFSEQKARG